MLNLNFNLYSKFNIKMQNFLISRAALLLLIEITELPILNYF